MSMVFFKKGVQLCKFVSGGTWGQSSTSRAITSGKSRGKCEFVERLPRVHEAF